MSLSLVFRKRLNSFEMDIHIQSEAKRIGILGESGSGKSMSLKCLAGIEHPDSGRISVGEKLLYDKAAHVDLKPQKRRVGYMFQNYALFPTMTILQNVECGILGSAREKKEKALQMLQRVRLEGLAGRYPRELSGGQQQRAALARILASEPEVILLDEPFSALDSDLKEKMQHELMTILDSFEGQVILVSHSRDELYRFCEEIYVIQDGKILHSGRTKELFQNPKYRDVARLTGCKNISAAQKIDETHVRALDWGIDLKVDLKIPDGLDSVGYQGHYFEPIWGEWEENCLKAESAGEDDLLFEKKIYIKSESFPEDNTKNLSWFVQEADQHRIQEKGMPDYLKLRANRIMLLEKKQ